MGVQGVPGATGPMGPQGMPGPAGITSTQIITVDSAAVEEGTSRIRMAARCPGGEKLTGGGFYHGITVGNPQESAFDIIENRPFRVSSGVDEWLVTAVNRRGLAWEAGALHAYVICTDTD
jgi:hypothetical protein